ncbi:MAG: hypothetical protein WA364_12815 [Candidatus Nitrosopolaris sp.]
MSNLFRISSNTLSLGKRQNQVLYAFGYACVSSFPLCFWICPSIEEKTWDIASIIEDNKKVVLRESWFDADERLEGLL